MRPKTLRLFLTTLALVSLTMGASTAFAAPLNDKRANATVINALPFQDYQDLTANRPTRRDWSDPDPSCINAPFSTVWYKIDGNNNWLNANTIGSDYDTFIAVYRYENGTPTEVACNDDGWGWHADLEFFAQTGKTYYIMVGGDRYLYNYGYLDFCVGFERDLPCGSGLD